MEIVGTQTIPARRSVVWDALNDPAVLQRCLPGCESVERTGATDFKVVVGAAIGPLRARFSGSLRMTEANPPASCVMVFEGQGGPVGFGQGSASVDLRDDGAATTLSYSARAQVGGKLAQVGSRLIDSVAKKMSDDFFKAFLKQFDAPVPAPVPAPAPAVVPRDEPNGTGGSSSALDRPAPVEPAPALTLPTPPRTAPAPHDAGSATVTAALVPAWWLGVATLLGSALTIASTLLLR